MAEAVAPKSLRKFDKKNKNSAIELVKPKDYDKDSVKLDLKKNGEERFDNDPIAFEKVNKDIEIEKIRENKNFDVYEFGFSFGLLNYICQCTKILFKKNLDLDKKLKYFDNASSIIEYYTDGVTYFKKMMEIEIIKYYIFTKDERRLISIISNPDFADVDKDHLIKRISNEYEKDRFTTGKIEEILCNVLKDARNKEKTNRLLQLIQLGNDKLIDPDDEV